MINQKRTSSHVEEKFQLLILKPEFKKDVEDIRKKYFINPKKPHHENFSEDKRKVWASNSFGKDINNIVVKYKLSPTLQHMATVYILNNQIHIPFNIESVPVSLLDQCPKKIKDKILNNYLNFKIVTKGYDNNSNKELYIKIFPETTIGDISLSWNLIKQFQKLLPGYNTGRNKKMVDFYRNKKIYKLHEQGKKNKEIAKIINSKFDTIFVYSDIAKIIQRFKHKIKDA